MLLRFYQFILKVDNLINDYSEDEKLVIEFQAKKEQIMEEKERLKADSTPVLAVLDRDDVKEVEKFIG